MASSELQPSAASSGVADEAVEADEAASMRRLDPDITFWLRRSDEPLRRRTVEASATMWRVALIFIREAGGSVADVHCFTTAGCAAGEVFPIPVGVPFCALPWEENDVFIIEARLFSGRQDGSTVVPLPLGSVVSYLDLPAEDGEDIEDDALEGDGGLAPGGDALEGDGGLAPGSDAIEEDGGLAPGGDVLEDDVVVVDAPGGDALEGDAAGEDDVVVVDVVVVGADGRG